MLIYWLNACCVLLYIVFTAPGWIWGLWHQGIQRGWASVWDDWKWGKRMQCVLLFLRLFSKRIHHYWQQHVFNCFKFVFCTENRPTVIAVMVIALFLVITHKLSYLFVHYWSRVIFFTIKVSLCPFPYRQLHHCAICMAAGLAMPWPMALWEFMIVLPATGGLRYHNHIIITLSDINDKNTHY